MNPRPLAVARFAAALTLGLAAIGASPAAQLFKCMEGGRTVYQQQACPVSGAEPAASAPPAASQAAPSRRLKPSAAPSSAPARHR